MVHTHSDLQGKTQLDNGGFLKSLRTYNELIGSWSAIVVASHDVGHTGEQIGLEL
jgi:putative DNA methylase